MGMPISLALRGRHAGDAPGEAAWAAALAVLRGADRTFSTYRADSVISRMNRGVAVDTPPEVADVLAIGAAAERSSGGAFALRRDGVLDPSGVVKGWAAERAAIALAALPDTDFCLSAGGDITCRTGDPAAAPWRIGIEDPRDRPGSSRSCRSAPARSRRPASPTAAPTSSTPARVARRAASRP